MRFKKKNPKQTTGSIRNRAFCDVKKCTDASRKTPLQVIDDAPGQMLTLQTEMRMVQQRGGFRSNNKSISVGGFKQRAKYVVCTFRVSRTIHSAIQVSAQIPIPNTGIGMYFTSMSRALNPRSWYRYPVLVSVPIPNTDNQYWYLYWYRYPIVVSAPIRIPNTCIGICER